MIAHVVGLRSIKSSYHRILQKKQSPSFPETDSSASGTIQERRLQEPPGQQQHRSVHDDDPTDGFGQHRPIGFSNRSFRWRPSTECYWGRCGSEGLTICHTLFLHPSVWRTLQGALQAQRGCTLAPQLASPAHQEAKKVLAALGTGYTVLGIRLRDGSSSATGEGSLRGEKRTIASGLRTGTDRGRASLCCARARESQARTRARTCLLRRLFWRLSS